MYAQQLSFDGLFMMEELCTLFSKHNIMYFRGDNYLLFETNTFGHLVHTININEEQGEYVVVIKRPNVSETIVQHSEKTIHYTDVRDVIRLVKLLQNHADA